MGSCWGNVLFFVFVVVVLIIFLAMVIAEVAMVMLLVVLGVIVVVMGMIVAVVDGRIVSVWLSRLWLCFSSRLAAVAIFFGMLS